MQIQPIRFGDALNGWFHTLRRNWKSLLLSSLFIHIPVGLAVAVLFWVTNAIELFDLYLDPELGSLTQSAIMEALGPFLWTVAIWTLLQILAVVLVNLAGSRAVAGDLAGEKFTWTEVTVFAWRRFGVGLTWSMMLLVGGILLIGIAVAIGWALITAAGANFFSVFVTAAAALTILVMLVWLGVSLSLGSQVIAMESSSAVEAISRSFSLVRGRWLVSFGYFALAGLIAGAAAQMVSIAISPLFFVGVYVPEALTVGIGVSVVLQGPLAAAISAAYSIWYVDLRARREELTATQLI